MNKKANTLLFVLGATLFNIFITLLSFVILTLLYVKFIIRIVPESGRGLVLAFLFVAAIVVSFLVYRVVLKFLIKKVEIEKHFDPIFTRRRKTRE
jgi:phosphoglycerol transferase MdoB-like AlkP superfamily enzyme